MHTFSLIPTFALDDIEDILDNQNTLESFIASNGEIESTSEVIEATKQPVEEIIKECLNEEEISNENVLKNEDNIINQINEVKEETISSKEDRNSLNENENNDNRDVNLNSNISSNSDAALGALSFFNNNNGSLTETFNPEKKDYTALVKGTSTTFMLGDNSIRTRSSSASMNIYFNGDLIFENVTGTKTQTFTLLKDITNIMKIVVTAENGTQNIYTVTFKREGSSDSTLKNISFRPSNTYLSEKFNPSTKDYIGVVKDNFDYVEFIGNYDNMTICVADNYAAMDVYFNDNLMYENIKRIPTVNLNLIKGITNVMKIIVTSEDGHQSTYTITFEREGYSNSTLKSISFRPSNAYLSENFNPSIKDYVGIVKDNFDYVEFIGDYNNMTIYVADSYATMDVYFNDKLIYENIKRIPTVNLNLIKGITNVMKIIVTSEGGHQSTYTIKFEREYDSNTNITNFSLNKGSLELDNDTYIATLNSWQDISVSKLTLEDSWADYKLTLNDTKEVALNEKFDLEIGNNKLDIEVTSNNGTKKTYPVIFERSDKTNPTVNSATNNQDWINDDVLINIESSDNSGIRYIELPNGEKVYSDKAEFSANQNGMYTFKIYDNFLNESVEIVDISNIDIELPTLELKPSTTALTNESVDIIIDTTDNVGIKSIETPDGKLVAKNTLTYNVQEDGTYTFTVTDLAGNKTTKSITINNIDSKKPILATELSNDDWSNKEITLSVYAISDKGIKYIELPDGSKIEDNTAEYEIKENGTYFISTESLGGNVTTEKVVVENIDIQLPTLTLIPSTEKWTNKDIHINIEAKDNTGIDYIVLPSGQKTYESSCTYSVSSNGIYEFTVFDLAGNKYTDSIEISNIDKEAPQIESHDNLISILHDTIKIDISNIKTPSGIYKIILPNGEEIINPTENIITFKVSRNGTYRFIVVDTAGNSVNVDTKVEFLKEEANINNNGNDNENTDLQNSVSNIPNTGGYGPISTLIFSLLISIGYVLSKKK